MKEKYRHDAFDLKWLVRNSTDEAIIQEVCAQKVYGDTIKPGDKVIASVAPERTGNHIGLLNKVQLASGRVLSAGAGAPPPDTGAPPPGAASNAPPPR